MLVIYAIIAVAVFCWVAYLIGKADGKTEANCSAIGYGTWVEVVKPVKSGQLTISPGTQGIVYGVDKWGRVGLWIAQPWVDVTGTTFVGGIDIGRLAVKPLSSIPDDDKEESFKQLQKFEESNAEFEAKHFLPGWREIQRKLNSAMP